MINTTRVKCCLFAVAALSLTLGFTGCTSGGPDPGVNGQPRSDTNGTAAAAGGSQAAHVGPSGAGPAGSQ